MVGPEISPWRVIGVIAIPGRWSGRLRRWFRPV